MISLLLRTEQTATKLRPEQIYTSPHSDDMFRAEQIYTTFRQEKHVNFRSTLVLRYRLHLHPKWSLLFNFSD
jgi:hypothetical protein